MPVVIYVVKPGDTLYKIAREYHVSVQRLISDNAIKNPNNLVVGQALLILVPKTVYTIQPGDTLGSIARKYKTTPIELLQNNPTLVDGGFVAGAQIAIEFQGEKRRELTVNAYAYPFVDTRLIRRVLPYLTYLTIFGYSFTDTGELTGIDDQPLIQLAHQFGAAPVMLLAATDAAGNFDGAKAARLFRNPEAQEKLLKSVVQVMKEKGYVGLDMDFEYIQAQDKDGYIAFLEQASELLHQNGFFLNTDLAPKTSAQQPGILYEGHDYPAIGAVSDTVLLMTYEWGYTYSPPMAVSPIDRVREVLRYAVTEISPSKILMGIPNYGYNWTLPFEKDGSGAKSVGNEEAVDIAMWHGAAIQFDEASMTPYFEYFAPNGKRHMVWFEDVRSIKAKLDLTDEFGLLGVGYWNAMRPFTQNWALLSALYRVRKII